MGAYSVAQPRGASSPNDSMQRLLLGLDTGEKKGVVRELELIVLGRLERVVRASLRDGLHEGLEVAAVALELEAVQVENVGDGVIQESRIVLNDD